MDYNKYYHIIEYMLKKYNNSNTKIESIIKRGEYYPVSEILYGKDGKPADFIVVNSGKIVQGNQNSVNNNISRRLGTGTQSAVYRACLAKANNKSKCNVADDTNYEYALKKMNYTSKDNKTGFLKEIELHNRAAVLGVTDPIILAYILPLENDNFEYGYVMKRYEHSLGNYIDNDFYHDKQVKGDDTIHIKHTIDELINYSTKAKKIIDTLLENGICHNDEHVGNFMIDSNGNLKIIDFGSALTSRDDEYKECHRDKSYDTFIKSIKVEDEKYHVFINEYVFLCEKNLDFAILAPKPNIKGILESEEFSRCVPAPITPNGDCQVVVLECPKDTEQLDKYFKLQHEQKRYFTPLMPLKKEHCNSAEGSTNIYFMSVAKSSDGKDIICGGAYVVWLKNKNIYYIYVLATALKNKGLIGQRIGSTIMNKIIEHAKENGIHSIGLQSLPGAEGFYEKIGFLKQYGPTSNLYWLRLYDEKDDEMDEEEELDEYDSMN